MSQDEQAIAAGLPVRIGIARRVIGYGLVGGLSLGVSYVITWGLMPVVGIQPAAVAAWVAAVCVGFAVNRRVTFGLVGKEKRVQEFALFVLGAFIQLLITLVGYAITLQKLHLNFNLAFAINIVTTTVFGFAYINLVTFRRAG